MKESFFFGKPDAALLGTYHAPPLATDRRYGILFCNPLGQEHIRAYRLFHKLAERLSGAGFHVLRFDYFATGDAAGVCDAGTPGRWVEDILTALAELRDCGDIERMSLFGLRMGATLAALAGQQHGHLHSMALWEPVLNGNAYLEEMRNGHQTWLQKQLFKRPNTNGNGGEEVIGFPLTTALSAELSLLDLFSLKRAPARYGLILNNETPSSGTTFREHLAQLGMECRGLLVPEQQVWLREERLDNSLVPNDSISAIIDWYKNISL